ncbi:MAG: hypothetical protein QX203_20025 [Methylococcaceae bacterium]
MGISIQRVNQRRDGVAKVSGDAFGIDALNALRAYAETLTEIVNRNGNTRCSSF